MTAADIDFLFHSRPLSFFLIGNIEPFHVPAMERYIPYLLYRLGMVANRRRNNVKRL